MDSKLGLGLAFAGAGLFAQLFAGWLALRTLRLIRAGGKAPGRIVREEEEMVPSSHGASRRYYFPVVAFTDAHGVNHQFQSRFGRGKALGVGSEIAVMFDPAQPDEAEISTFGTRWFFPIITSLFGFPFLAAGVVALMQV